GPIVARHDRAHELVDARALRRVELAMRWLGGRRVRRRIVGSLIDVPPQVPVLGKVHVGGVGDEGPAEVSRIDRANIVDDVGLRSRRLRVDARGGEQREEDRSHARSVDCVSSMRQRAIEAQLRELVRRRAPEVTVRFPRKRRPPNGYSWNGKHLRPTGQTLESQIHEIAHFLVAPPSRWAYPEFGLGPDPYRRNFVERVIPQEEADREEADAGALQLLIVTLLRLDAGAVMTEVHVAPLDDGRIDLLRSRYPDALPPEWWQRAHEAVRDR